MAEMTGATSVPAHSGTDISARTWQHAVTAMFTVVGLAGAAWFSRIPDARDVLHASTAEVSVLLLSLSVGSIAGIVTASRIAAAVGAKLGLSVTLSVLSLGLCGTGFAVDGVRSLMLSCGTLALFGFGCASTDVLMNVEGARAQRAVGKTKLPLMHGFFSIGTMMGAASGLAATIFNIAVAVYFSVIAGVVLIVGLAAIAFIPAASPRATRIEACAPVPATEPWFDVRLVLVGVVIAGAAFAEGSGNDWIALAVVDGHHFSAIAGIFVYGLFVTAMTVGRLAGGPLLDRFGASRMVAVLSAIAVVGIVAVIVASSPLLIVCGTLLWGLGVSLGFPASISAAADHPTHAGQRVSVVTGFGYATSLAGPVAIGMMASRFGILIACGLVAVGLAVASMCSPALRPRLAAPELGRVS